MKLGLCYHPRLLSVMAQDFNPPGHPENSARIETVYQVLEQHQHFFQPIPYNYEVEDFYLTPYYICRSLMAAIEAERILYGYAAIRPPGHHSLTTSLDDYLVSGEPAALQPRLFCGINYVAVLAKELAIKYQLGILDIDTHFSQGTYSVLQDQTNLVYVDIFSALFDKSITKIPPNFHLQAVSTRTQWIKAVKQAQILLSNCDFLLISLGFDFLRQEADGVDALITDLDYIVEVCRGKKTLLILEGGYHLNNLKEGHAHLIRQLANS